MPRAQPFSQVRPPARVRVDRAELPVVRAESARRSQHGARALSIRAATASSSSPKSAAYMSSVCVADLWPSIDCTPLIDAPDAIAKDAAACRRACGVAPRYLPSAISPRPTATHARFQTWRRKALRAARHPAGLKKRSRRGPFPRTHASSYPHAPSADGGATPPMRVTHAAFGAARANVMPLYRGSHRGPADPFRSPIVRSDRIDLCHCGCCNRCWRAPSPHGGGRVGVRAEARRLARPRLRRRNRHGTDPHRSRHHRECSAPSRARRCGKIGSPRRRTRRGRGPGARLLPDRRSRPLQRRDRRRDLRRVRRPRTRRREHLLTGRTGVGAPRSNPSISSVPAGARPAHSTRSPVNCSTRVPSLMWKASSPNGWTSPYRPGVRSSDWLKLKTAEWKSAHDPMRHPR